MPTIRTKHGRTPDPRSCRIHLPSSKVVRPPNSRSAPSLAEQDDQAILCGICSAEVTRRRQAIAVNGCHLHAFFNPAGIAFEIRCFRLVPGAVPCGESSAEFTWFSGYRWQIALCATCQSHLGWLFTSDSAFYGLIATRLSGAGPSGLSG